MIYVIGDSHVSVFAGTDKTHNGLRHIQPEFGTCYTLSKGQLRTKVNRFEQKIPHFCAIKIGSNTAYNSYDKLPIIEQAIEEYEITSDDYLFLCFGEIDIRNHIGFNAVKMDMTISENIKLCVDRYLKTILHIKDSVSNLGVYAPPPSSIGTPQLNGYKDVITRNIMTIEFSGYLKEKCDENGIIFKDISKLMMLDDLTTDKKYLMDELHLSQEAIPLLNKEFEDLI